MSAAATDLVNYDDIIANEIARMRKSLASNSSGRISTEGKVFTMPDKSVHPGPIYGIILDYISFNRYYKSQYNRKTMSSPDCFAIGGKFSSDGIANHKGLVPHEQVPNQQNDQCDTCPLNQFVDGQPKPCKNMYVMAIIPPDADSVSEICTLNVSPSGLTSFNKMCATALNQHKLPPMFFVTKIAFNPDYAQPVLTFSFDKKVENLELVIKAREAASQVLDEFIDRTFFRYLNS